MNEINLPGGPPGMHAPITYCSRPITTPQEGVTTVSPANPALPVSPDNIAVLTPKTVEGVGDLWSLPDGTADNYDAEGRVIRRVGRLTLDGTEGWTLGTLGNNGIQGSTVNIALHFGITGGISAYCTHFMDLGQTDAASFYIWGSLNPGGVDLIIPKSLLSAPTLDAAKTWLAAQKAAGTPVTILYGLARPTTQWITITGPITTKATDLAAPSWVGKSTLSGDPSPTAPITITGKPFVATATDGSQIRSADLGFVGYDLPDGTADTYDGKVGELVQRTAKLVLDGTEAGWFLSNMGAQTNTVNIAMGVGPIRNTSAVCTHFVDLEDVSDAPHFYMWPNLQGVDLFIPRSLLSAPTLDAAKAWLAAQKAAGTPVTVHYARAEPICTTVKADLQCFEGQTTITGADSVEIVDNQVVRFGGYLPEEKAHNYNVLTNGDLLEWALLQTVSGNFLAAGGVSGMPIQSYFYGELIVAGWDRSLLLWDCLGNLYTRSTIAGKWDNTTWIRFAMATAPSAWLEAPMEAGYSAIMVPKYGKDGSGTVYLIGVVKKGSVPLSSEAILRLPEGYRPAIQWPVIFASNSSSDGGAWATYGYLWPDGYLKFAGGAIPQNYNANKAIVFSIKFPT